MQVFIIHGHDLDALQELRKFLEAFGIDHLSFELATTSGRQQ